MDEEERERREREIGTTDGDCDELSRLCLSRKQSGSRLAWRWRERGRTEHPEKLSSAAACAFGFARTSMGHQIFSPFVYVHCTAQHYVLSPSLSKQP
jgi:hypothetical protein